MIQGIVALLSLFSRLPAVLYRLTGIFGGWLSLSRVSGWIVSLCTMGFFTIALPLAIEWGLFNVLLAVTPSISGNFDLSPTIIRLSGVAAWLADCFELPLVISIQLGFAMQSLLLRLASGRPILRA